MPWQQQAQPSYQAQPYQAQPPYPGQGYPPQPSYAPPPQPPAQNYYPGNPPTLPPAAAREQDDRQLDRLASRFYAIHQRDPYALDKLYRLQREVQDFRSHLAYGGYDARDIEHDARKLEHRIGSQRHKWELAAGGPVPQPHPPYVQPVPYGAPGGQPAYAPPPLYGNR